MTRKEVVDFLQFLEEKYPVDKWKVGTIEVWPIVKIQAFFFWFRSQQSFRKRKQSNKTRFLLYMNSFMAWLNFFTTRYRRVDYVFSGHSTHRSKNDELQFNRYFDPVMDYLEARGKKTLLVEQNEIAARADYYRVNRIVEFTRLFPLARLTIRLFVRKQSFAGESELAAVFKEIENTVPGIDRAVMKKAVFDQVKAIQAWKIIFDSFFSRIKPSYVFGLCYYSSMMYGMNLSANSRNIISVDMQHGTQGSLHVAYSNFSKVPKGGYKLLPQYFWCWDLNSAKQISQWCGLQNFHKVVVGGNPWLTLWSSVKRANNRTVLYTLQPLDPVIPQVMIDTIKLTREMYNWSIRLHPRQREGVAQIRRVLDEHGINGVEITDGYTRPLPLSLVNSIVHISRFSGSVLEAAFLGIPSIVIDEVGVRVYKNEIAEGLVYAYLTEDAQGLAELIARLTRVTLDSSIMKFESTIESYFE